MTIEADIKQRALELGFDAVGITTAEPVEPAQVDFYREWLADGRAAEMGYLHRNLDKRFAPGKLLAGARSVICVALNYRPTENRPEACSTLRIARYAQYEDYHPFMKERLFQLADFIGSAGISPATKDTCDRDGRAPGFKACVDSAPLAERALACRAGVGFIGRNHMLIHPDLGGQILLGELITTLELEPDTPTDNKSCEGCNRCIQACPTGALAADGSFDARKCISYLTIEAGNATVPVASDFSCGRDARVPNYIFGCDECLLACPHETNAPPRVNRDFTHHPEWQSLTRQQILDMSESEFKTVFAGSGLLRPGLERLQRNCSR